MRQRPLSRFLIRGVISRIADTLTLMPAFSVAVGTVKAEPTLSGVVEFI